MKSVSRAMNIILSVVGPSSFTLREEHDCICVRTECWKRVFEYKKLGSNKRENYAMSLIIYRILLA
jgi:hypothetical protein